MDEGHIFLFSASVRARSSVVLALLGRATSLPKLNKSYASFPVP